MSSYDRSSGPIVHEASQRNDINAVRPRRPSMSQMKAELGAAPEERLSMDEVATYVYHSFPADDGRLFPALPFEFIVNQTGEQLEKIGGRVARTLTFDIFVGDPSLAKQLGSITLKLSAPQSNLFATRLVGFEFTTEDGNRDRCL